MLVLLFPLAGGILGLQRMLFAPAEPPSLRLLHAGTGVEYRRARGAWRPASTDARIRSGDAIRTPRDVGVTLALSPGDTLEISGDTELLVAQLGTTVQEIVFLRGELVARLGHNPRRVVRFTGQVTALVLESIGGEFAIRSDGQGAARVRCVSGEVLATRAGQRRRLRPGEEIVRSTDSAAATAPGLPRRLAVPASVILKARWPKRESLGSAGGESAGAAVVGLRGVRLSPRSGMPPLTTPTQRVGKGRWKFRLRAP